MPKLTKRVLDELAPGASEKIEWDIDLRGFGVRVQPSGVKTFLVQYRNAEGRSRRMTIGRYGSLTPDEARKLAVQTLAAVAKGGDPAANRKAARVAPTMGELLDRYLEEHVKVYNAATTTATIGAIVEAHVRPRLGTLKAGSVTRQDIIKLHRGMASTPRHANHALSIMSKVFSLAELWAIRPENSNPCRKVPRYPEVHRERFLTTEELPRLGEALLEAETIGLPWSVDESKATAKHFAKPENRRALLDPIALAAIRLLIFTGARRMEILALCWEHVDFERGTIALPDRKGGARAPHPASAVAMDILARIDRLEGSPWVLPRAGDRERHVSKEVITHAWERLRERAGIPDVNLHDLRHTVGTYASQAGANAFVVRDVLRHKTLQMTGRYANFDADPVRGVFEAVGERISSGLRSRTEAAGASN